MEIFTQNVVFLGLVLQANQVWIHWVFLGDGDFPPFKLFFVFPYLHQNWCINTIQLLKAHPASLRVGSLYRLPLPLLGSWKNQLWNVISSMSLVCSVSDLLWHYQLSQDCMLKLLRRQTLPSTFFCMTQVFPESSWNHKELSMSTFHSNACVCLHIYVCVLSHSVVSDYLWPHGL